MHFQPATTEQKFVLDHVTRIGELAAHPRFADATPDLVDAIVNGVGQLAADIWAPTNRMGDTHPPVLKDGVVTMPPGFKAAYQAYVDGGWGTLDAPTEFGGQGLPFALATVALENLGTANMGFRLCPTLTVGAIEAIHTHGNDAQRAEYLPKLITGEWTGTMNLTEPQAGSDVGALRTTANPLGDGSFAIKGTKIYITFGEHDLTDNIIHLVLARTPDAPSGTKGISLFLVPKMLPNGTRNDVHCSSIEHKLGIHASPTCVLNFGDSDACTGWLIGPEMGGIRAMFTMMNNARLNVGLQGVDIAERATQAAMGYARDRVQSARASGASSASVPIIDHPDVRRMLMDMQAHTMAIRGLLYYAAGQVDRATLGLDGAKARADLLTPLAKSHGSDIGCLVTSIGIQVHGGMGYVEETGAAQYYRDARIAPIYEGTNGIQAADLVGRKMTGDGGAAIASLITDMRSEAQHPALIALIDACERTIAWMLMATIDDRLAGSAPFLTMLSVATSGWLIERQGRIATKLAITRSGDRDFLAQKTAISAYYLSTIVPHACGLEAAATLGADMLYGLSAPQLAKVA